MDKIKNIFLQWPIDDSAFRPLFSSFCVLFLILLLAIIVNILARKTSPYKKPKGLVLLFEIGVDTFDNMVNELMGPRFKGFGGYIFFVSLYMFISFIWGLTGFDGPLNNLAGPLTLGLCTFFLIHSTAVRFNKIRYFKRYVEPFPFFLPINLLSMWAPLLSITFRLFGNVLAGWTLMSVIYYGLESLSSMLFSFVSDPSGLNTVFVAPIIAPWLHAYFDLFSGLIQTVIYIMLTMLWVAAEAPEEEEIKQSLAV